MTLTTYEAEILDMCNERDTTPDKEMVRVALTIDTGDASHAKPGYKALAAMAKLYGMFRVVWALEEANFTPAFIAKTKAGIDAAQAA